MLSVKHSGSFLKSGKKLVELKKDRIIAVLRRYGDVGVRALSDATPVDSGETRSSWTYSVESSGARFRLSWRNTNVNDGVCIAIILQYGHGTRTGGYVSGVDYINPAMAPVFESIKREIQREVRNE